MNIDFKPSEDSDKSERYRLFLQHYAALIEGERDEISVMANTVAALNNGAMFGTAAQLDGLADRVEAELGQPLTVVVTGGLAPYITPCCKRKVIYDADLLFKGLALIWEKNHL